MTPQQLLNDAGIFLKDYAIGRCYTTCPVCSAKRQPRHQKLKCVGVTITDQKTFWGCNHCGWTGPERGSGNGRDGWPHYDYGPDFRKVRRPSGGFFWQHRNGNGGWDSGAAGTGELLYRIDEVAQAIAAGEVVLVVEGEKDANSCWDLGFAATCNSSGASPPGQAPKWTTAHSEQLRGADLVVAGDNDEPGRAHLAAVCQASHGVAKSLRTIDLVEQWPEIPLGGDISDYLVAAGARAGEFLEQLVAESRHYVPEPAAKQKPAAPLPLANLALDGAEVPAAEWAVHNRIPLRQVCLLSGHGAVGKSTIALQLAAAHAICRDWLGSMPALGSALFLDCEDDFNEIWRRLETIRKFYGVNYQNLVDGGLEVLPMAGLESVMATVNANSGTVTATAFYQQVLERAGDLKHVNVIIANASNVFAGNENDRSQVQQFISLLKRITNASGGAVTLISHSSLAGLSTETGLSGSTQWHNAVRARIWMHAAKGNGADHQPDSDLRVLEFMKNQYGRVDDSVALRWKNGLYLPEETLSGYKLAAREAEIETVFITILVRFNKNKRRVSPSPSTTWAPKVFEDQEEAIAAKASKKELKAAMDRLFKSGRIEVKSWGTASHMRSYIDISN